MRELKVELGANSYPIHIGRELGAGALEAALAGREAVCLVDARVELLHADRLGELVGKRPRITIPEGEGSKSLALLGELAERLLALGLGRDGMLVAIGGGVTGDLTGFLAASYQRGIPWIQVPTTLLAQVDASVGGKVAVNLPGAKNSLGFFHQPEAVIAELAFLETLPKRQIAAGLAEMLKMGAILDADYLGRLDKCAAAFFAGSGPELAEAVLRSCELKAAIVARDEREAGPRQLLNFGHTLAHAIEGFSPKPDVLHGEAVAIGMSFALALGERIGFTAAGRRDRMDELLARLRLPSRVPSGPSPEALRALMDNDKKKRGSDPRFVLVGDWGNAKYGLPVAEDTLMAELAAYCAGEREP